MGPGPSAVSPEVYEALAHRTLGHLDPCLITVMDEIKAFLRTVMGTRNPLTLPVSGTGSVGMEAAVVKLVEPGDPVLVLVNGVFGTRMVEVATGLGAWVEALEFERGDTGGSQRCRPEAPVGRCPPGSGGPRGDLHRCP